MRHQTDPSNGAGTSRMRICKCRWAHRTIVVAVPFRWPTLCLSVHPRVVAHGHQHALPEGHAALAALLKASRQPMLRWQLGEHEPLFPCTAEIHAQPK